MGNDTDDKILIVCAGCKIIYHICPDMQLHASKKFGHKRMVERPLTLGATGGSLSAIAWRFLAESLHSPALPVPVECPLCDCECPSLSGLNLGSLDLQSVVVGVFIGLLLGPALDLLVLLRAAWRWWVRSRLRELAARSTELYRFA